MCDIVNTTTNLIDGYPQVLKVAVCEQLIQNVICLRDFTLCSVIGDERWLGGYSMCGLGVGGMVIDEG